MLTALGSFGALMYYMYIPLLPENYEKRRNTLLGFAALSGCSLGPLIEMVAIMASKWTVFAALSATTIVFACFSMSAVLTQRRSYLFLGGYLSSALSVMCWLGLISLFFPNRANYLVQLYGGLLLYSGFVIFDTQVIVEQAYQDPKRDVLNDAFKLFIDFVALLRRILIILLQNQQRKERKSRERDSRERDSRYY